MLITIVGTVCRPLSSAAVAHLVRDVGGDAWIGQLRDEVSGSALLAMSLMALGLSLAAL